MLLHGLVEASVTGSPEAAPPIDEGRTTFYAELDRLAHRFATTYREAGVVGHDHFVGAAHKLPVPGVRRTEVPARAESGKIDESRLPDQARAAVGAVAAQR